MRYGVEELEEKARIRIKSIPKLIEGKRVYAPRNPIATFLTTWGWRSILRRRDVRGLENLDLAMSQISEVMPVTLVGPHFSDADTLFLEQAVRGGGRGAYADKFVYVAGLNMNERPHVRINTLGGNRIFVETPFILADLEEILSKGDLQPGQKELLEEFLRNGNHLTSASLREMIHARKRGQPIVIYPQSARASKPFIERGHPKTESYLKKGIILPFMIRGSERFLPPKKVPPIWKWIKEGWTVDVEFGKSFEAEQTQAPEVRRFLTEMDANPVDLVMTSVCQMDWDRVSPDILELHQIIAREVPLKTIAG